MIYIYTTLLLHKAGKEINEENIRKVLEAAGVKPDPARIKALVAALEGVNIDDALKKAAAPAPPAAPAAPPEEKPKEEKKEEKKKEKKKDDEAAAGLSALFG